MKSVKYDINIKKIITMFLYAQPFIDIATYFTNQSTILSLGIIIRSLFLLILVFYNLKKFNLKENYKMYLYILFIGIYIGIYLLLLKNEVYFFQNFINIFKTFYYPIILVLILNIFKKEKIEINYKVFGNLFIIYIGIILLADITNTSNLSYNHSKVGNVGWFISANEISAILSILMPFVFLNLIKIKNILLKLLIIISSIYVLFTIGTKGPIIALFMIIAVALLKSAIELIKNKKYKKIILITLSIILAIIISLNTFKKTPFYKNLVIHYSFLEMNNPMEIFRDYDKFNHFIFSERLTFLSYADKAYDKSDVTTKLFGLGYYIESSPGKFKEKLIEMDILEIFYRHGIIGFIIYFIPSIYIFIKLFKKSNEKLNDEKTAYLESLFMIILFSLIIGHTLTAPAVSIYVSVIYVNFYMGRKRIK